MDTKNKPLIIGITGPFGSGKSTAANFFIEKGFTRVTLSSFLEKDLKKRNVGITRKNLQDLGNEWREKFGYQILAEKSLDLILKQGIKKAVIDGIRNVGEIKYLRKNANFILIGIVADRKIRFERVKKLKDREVLDPDLFEELDYRDLGIEGTEKNGLQVAKCLAIADYFIDTNE